MARDDSDLKNARLVIAGGGTGGHVLAGIAVADEWATLNNVQDKGRVLFIGSMGRMEEKLVPKSGYSLECLKLGSLNRVSVRTKLKTTIQLPIALIRSTVILMKFKPRFVLGVGGYSSGPVVLMAAILNFLRLNRARIGIIEQNLIPGFTNRVLSRFVHFVFTVFPGTEKYIQGKKWFRTGNPIRSSMSKMTSSARNRPFTVFIFGGSQGALGINSLVLSALPHLKSLSQELDFVHQTGEKDYQRVLEGHQKWGTHAKVEKFVYDMVTAYREASLLICRSGSSTLAEIAAIGRASILIPLPTAADNHQELNAKVFADAGAALLVSQTSASGETLAELIKDLMQNPEKIEEMETKVRPFYFPNAAKNVVQEFIRAGKA